MRGDDLYYSIGKDLGIISEDQEKNLKDLKIKIIDPKYHYDSWYSEALTIIKQLLPDRETDFIRQYKIEKRKETDFLTYGISDYLLGVRVTRLGDVIVDGSAALPKMANQVAILYAVKARFESKLFDIQEVLQADIFDSELEAAKELAKKGFVRGGGAVAGVVLEKHLRHVCDTHKLGVKKKNPAISDLNDLLKNNDVIDTPKWRFIQHLGDLRNLCDHNKNREPTKEEVIDLVDGVDKVIKTVF